MPTKKREAPKGARVSKRASGFGKRRSVAHSLLVKVRTGVPAKSITAAIARKNVKSSAVLKVGRLPISQEDSSSPDLLHYLDNFAAGKETFNNVAEEMLSKGIPTIVYSEELREGEMLKIYPDNKKEVITLDGNYQEIVVRKL